MKRIIVLALTVVGIMLLAACGPAAAPTATPAAPAKAPAAAPAAAPAPEIQAHAGRLYDNWMKELGLSVPAANQALWATQTTNTRKGADTWRCKECHGWDYKGKDGAYGKGSHLTGFPSVEKAVATMNREQLLKVMSGGANPSHNFSALLGDLHTGHLVDFLLRGVINEAELIDYNTKKPLRANVTNGKAKYDGSCVACHGADGRTLKFGEEVVGTIAKDNPWEFLHKVRFGQPGAQMPPAIVAGWSIQDVVDVLGHAQTLPDK